MIASLMKINIPSESNAVMFFDYDDKSIFYSGEKYQFFDKDKYVDINNGGCYLICYHSVFIKKNGIFWRNIGIFFPYRILIAERCKESE